MQRETRAPRANWRERCEEAGFYYHSMGGTYWDESACYAFSAEQIDRLEDVTAELHHLCLQAVKVAINSKRLAEFAIPERFHDLVAQSWARGEQTLYGRFDFSWDGAGEPKLLEYNADTPTSLPAAAVAQWHWLEDTKYDREGPTPLPADADQFNSLHEKLIATASTIFEVDPTLGDHFRGPKGGVHLIDWGLQTTPPSARACAVLPRSAPRAPHRQQRDRRAGASRGTQPSPRRACPNSRRRSWRPRARS